MAGLEVAEGGDLADFFGKGRIKADQGFKIGSQDDKEFNAGLRDGRRGMGAILQERHLTEDIAGPQKRALAR